MITLTLETDAPARAAMQTAVTQHHYLHSPVDPRCRWEGYSVRIDGVYGPVGFLMFGRPEATRCYPFYGSVDDVTTGRAAVTRWQVLNLARVWFDPQVQPGGIFYTPDHLPGFTDRRGTWRSTLASTAIGMATARVGFDYLDRRPPCFLDEPYGIAWVLSYCDTRVHRGSLYRAAGFELYRENPRGIQTYRLPVPPLTAQQDAAIQERSHRDKRANQYRAGRAQLALFA